MAVGRNKSPRRSAKLVWIRELGTGVVTGVTARWACELCTELSAVAERKKWPAAYSYAAMVSSLATRSSNTSNARCWAVMRALCSCTVARSTCAAWM